MIGAEEKNIPMASLRESRGREMGGA